MECQRADQEVPKENGLRRYMTIYSLQQPKRKNFRHAGGRRFRIKTTQSGHLHCRKRKGKAGTERAITAEGATRTQWEGFQEEARERK